MSLLADAFTSVSLCFLVCKTGLTTKAIHIGLLWGLHAVMHVTQRRGLEERAAVVFGCCWCQERRCLGVFPSRGSSCPYSFPCGLPSGLCMCAQHGQWGVFQMGWPRHMTDWGGIKRWRGPPFTASVYYFSWTCSQSVVAGSCEGQTPPCWGLGSSCWGLPAPPSGWTLGSLTHRSSSGIPGALGLLVAQENRETAMQPVSARTCSFGVKKTSLDTFWCTFLFSFY